MFILTIGHFFDDNIYSIVTRCYGKKNVKKKLTRATIKLLLMSFQLEFIYLFIHLFSLSSLFLTN